MKYQTVPSKRIMDLIKSKNRGVSLDVGCGNNKNKGFIGLDIQKLEGVDIVHDIEVTPYPLPSECCTMILASHIVEHLNPKMFIPVMNEWWRLMRVGGQLAIAMPYGVSYGYVQDPTHSNPCNEATWMYFSSAPEHKILYDFYKPKPWKIDKNIWFETGNMEVLLSKVQEVKK